MLGSRRLLVLSLLTLSAAAQDSAWDRVDFDADLRLRHESNVSLPGADDRHRERLRFRFGARYDVRDDVEVGARITTGDPNDPRSPHVTLGDGFDKLDFNFDRLYVTWRPEGWAGSWLTGGKFSHPFARNPVYGELVWDADLQPEGLAAGKRWTDAGPFQELRATLASYTLLESSSADAYAYGAQLAARAPDVGGLRSDVALTFYGVTNPTPGGDPRLLAGGTSNATRDLDNDGLPDEFVSDFRLLEALASVGPGEDLPLVLSAQFVRNTAAEVDGDQGWAFGVAYGPGGGVGWKAYYQWQVIERDALFAPFAQDDFLLTTNQRAHLAGVQLPVGEGIRLHLWALVSEPDASVAGDEDMRWRLRADLDFSLL